MKPKILPIVVISLLLGLTFDLLFYDKAPGISILMYASLILGFTFYLARRFKNSLNKSIYGLAPVILFFALMVYVRANLFLAAMNIVLIIYLLLLVARLAHQPAVKLGQYGIAQYAGLLVSTPLRVVREFCLVLVKSVSSRSTKVPTSSYAPILRGLLLSLPVLVVFVLLLSSADLVFKGFIDSIFNLNISEEVIVQSMLIGFVTSMLIGAYAFIFMPSSKPEAAPAPARTNFNLGTTESSIVLGSVGVLFLVFVIIQLAYLFGGSGQVMSSGYTYAEYARKGFFELTLVAAISLLLVSTINRSAKQRTSPPAATIKWLSGALIAEVMVIMFSAHMRLSLYEEAYGFTALRLLSHLFILWLACAFILLVVHIVRQQRENQFAFQLFISALCFFAVVNIINPDAFIARQNIDRFDRVGKIDADHLAHLSGDAVPVVAKFLDHPDKDVRQQAASILYRQKQHSAADHFTEWQSANWGRQRANQVFRDHMTQIETGKPGDNVRSTQK